MPIRFEKTLAVLDGNCAVEEAESLLDWLKSRKRPRVDLSGCEHLHTAVLQLLIAARPAVVAWPEDALWRRWLSAALPTDTPS
ncbi:hypothetical protein [Azospirillum endophyticum]